MAGFFTATGKAVLNIIPLVIAIIAWDKMEEALKPTGITMLQFIGWSVFIVVVLGTVTYVTLVEVVKAQENKKKPITLDNDERYLREKALYIKTGKVSNWDQEGRNLFNFEVKSSRYYIPPPVSSLSGTRTSNNPPEK